MLAKPTNACVDIRAVLWVDRERRYFVTTNGKILYSTLIYRNRWRRAGNESLKTLTETVHT